MMNNDEKKQVVEEEIVTEEVKQEVATDEVTDIVADDVVSEENVSEETPSEDAPKKEKTSTELLMEESAEAEKEMNVALERDARNTRLCYERALQQFYDEEGINAESEARKKQEAIEFQQKIDAMSFGEELKYRFGEYKKDWQNPTLRKIKSAKFAGVLLSILRAVILFGLCFVIFIPIVEKISYAFRHPIDIANPQVLWIPETWSTMNIKIAYEILTAEGNTFLNSLTLSFFTTIIQVMATAVAGYAFARLKFKGSTLLFYIVIASLAVPPEALKVSRTLFFTYNTFFGISMMQNAATIYIMSLFGQGVRSAIFIFLFRQTFRNLPIELEESAEIDGAGVIRTFWSVMLPNAKGTIVTVSLFAFVWQYNDYYFATMFGYKRSMPLLTTALAGQSEMLNSVIGTQYPTLARDFGEGVISGEFYELIAQTGALLMMLPLLIAYLFIQRLFVESVERSGITGM